MTESPYACTNFDQKVYCCKLPATLIADTTHKGNFYCQSADNVLSMPSIYAPLEMIQHKNGKGSLKDKKFKQYFTLSILAVLCSSVGWSLMYRINWDIGEIVFPSAVYPYWYQTVFCTVLFIIIFIILLIITYKVFKKAGKSPEKLFYW